MITNLLCSCFSSVHLESANSRTIASLGDVVKIKWVIKSFSEKGNVAASRDINQMQMPPFVIICGVSTVVQCDLLVFIFLQLFCYLKNKFNFSHYNFVYFISGFMLLFVLPFYATSICAVAPRNLICFVHFLEAFVCHAFLHLNLRLICILCTSIFACCAISSSQFCCISARFSHFHSTFLILLSYFSCVNCTTNICSNFSKVHKRTLT